MKRPSNYSTKHAGAILRYLSAHRDDFVTAPQIARQLSEGTSAVSRPTVYRQLEKLEKSGLVRRYFFGGEAAAHYRFAVSESAEHDVCHLKCKTCDGIFDIDCGEVDQVSRHISESHEFRVNDAVFYGLCKQCSQNGGRTRTLQS